MRIHTALISAFILAGSTSLLADPLHTEALACGTDQQGTDSIARCTAEAQQTPHGVLILAPDPAMLGDITGGRGPDTHARELREMAVAAAIGNDDRVLIGARQLHKFGVTREAVREVIDQAQLHTGSVKTANRRFFVVGPELPAVEPGWENSQ